MMKKLIDVCLIIFYLLILFLDIKFVFELKEMYEYYKCSTISSDSYYVENNCSRFER
jgi:hypothetical protein